MPKLKGSLLTRLIRCLGVLLILASAIAATNFPGGAAEARQPETSVAEWPLEGRDAKHTGTTTPPLGQLATATHPGDQPDEAFTFDSLGNRTSNGEVYDAANRLLLDNDNTYSYDNEGSLLSKTDRVFGMSTTFKWDADQRQREVTSPTGITTRYRYDPRGRRIESSSAGEATRFGFGLSSNPLFEYDASGGIAASFVFGSGSDQPLAMHREGQTHFHLQDMLANVTALTTSTGAPVERRTYSAFGEQAAPSSQLGNPFSFAGRQWDSESKTYYNRARQYDPGLGRFTSDDPIPAANGYAYAGNDPVASRDPTGLFTLSELGAANSIRGELASEQLGFGLNLIAAIGGDNGTEQAMAGAVGLAGPAGFAKLARTLRRVRSSQIGLRSVYPDEIPGLPEAISRARRGAGTHSPDGRQFNDDFQVLPPGFKYSEWYVPTPGDPSKGVRRLVISQDGGLVFYSDDHYLTFRQVVID